MSDIGAGGEHFFMGFCSVDGVTANKSSADKHGWDVFVEVEQETGELTLMTLHEPIIAGKVQVKSTRTTSLKVDVTLSNLRKMATSPLPSFYVLMDFSQGPHPQRAFIRHVDEPLIREILQRVNTHIIAGKAERLHKLTLRVDFGLGREIRLSEPSTFKSEILRAIGSSPAKYTDKKSMFLKNVGFEDGCHAMHFQLEGMGNLTAFVNATLGMGGSVELQNMQFSTTRFGQVDPRSRTELSAGIMELTPVAPAAKGTLTFRDLSSGVSALVEASAFFSPMHEWLPKSLKKIRIDCGTFDWLMNEDGSSAQFTATLDPELPIHLDGLANFFQIVCLLRRPESLSIEMDFYGTQSSVIVKRGVVLPDYSRALETADLLMGMKSFFADREHLTISATELIHCDQNIRAISGFLNRKTGARISFRFVEAHDPFEAACLVPLALRVGGKCYVAVIAIFGDMSRSEQGRYTVATTDFDVLYKTVLRENELNTDKILLRLEPIMTNYTHFLPIVNLVPVMLDFVLSR
ncbi:hypothetical protein SAMN05216496_2038 [Pseudomonas sp. Z003-0.4C(8344-21)]|uniref:hypothetical protein n=1 Tax=Pseudomonas sp. Z003-0.4C(8344-21) TaxID=1855380 RepID=UPI00087B0FBB|nr:hypothetical protein [Pseudomonas sp. Z003-0.4C(8344-21)]SDS63449.1 hypothetical protein SAMN05216496_2038 [Pseudomonas sp. Z003-0.4C(8344-21)]